MYYFLFGALRAEEGKTQRAHEISHWIQKDEEEDTFFLSSFWNPMPIRDCSSFNQNMLF